MRVTGEDIGLEEGPLHCQSPAFYGMEIRFNIIGSEEGEEEVIKRPKTQFEVGWGRMACFPSLKEP